MPNQRPNEHKSQLTEGSASAALTVQDSPAPPALVVPGGWRIEGLPGTVREAGLSAERRLLEFFTAEISNPNTRTAYSTAAGRFFRWCETRNLALRAITPFAVATYIEEMQDRYTLPTVKQHLSALRALLDYLVVGQVLPTNPAAPVRGPKYVVKHGKTPVLSVGKARTLLADSIAVHSMVLVTTLVQSIPPHHSGSTNGISNLRGPFVDVALVTRPSGLGLAAILQARVLDQAAWSAGDFLRVSSEPLGSRHRPSGWPARQFAWARSPLGHRDRVWRLRLRRSANKGRCP